MDINEINQYLQTSSSNDVCISRQILKNYNKKVRDIIIKRNNEVLIEFNDYGFDEGGLYIKFKYENQSILIASLEEYLNQPMISWTNFTKTDDYPDLVDSDNENALFIDDLTNGKLSLPRAWIRYEVLSSYWSKFIPKFN